MRPGSVMAMREWHGQWVIDVGTGHGFARSGITHAAVHGSDPVLQVAVRQMTAGHTTVEPLGWQPKSGLVYPMVLSGLAMPTTRVRVGGGPGDDEAVARLLRDAVNASPYLKVTGSVIADVTVRTPARGSLTLHDPAGRRLAGCPVEAERAGRPQAVELLEHIARWRRVRHLSNPVSRLAERAGVSLIAPRAGGDDFPLRGPGLTAGPGGAIVLEYRPHAQGFSPPGVFVRVDNAWHRPLFGALLRLTGRFEIHADLFAGGFIDAGTSVAAGLGKVVESVLPQDCLLQPGARMRDWLMLIVAEERFDSGLLTLPPLGRGGGPPAASGPADIVEHLALKAQHHDAAGLPAAAGDWWVRQVAVDTRVPGGEADE